MDFLLNSFTSALGWSMLHSLWQGAAIYTGICLLYLFYPNLSARIKYRFSYGGQVLLLLLFSCTFLYYVNIPGLLLEQDSANYQAFTGYIQQQTNQLHSLERLFPWFSSVYILGLLMQLAFFSNSYNRLNYLRRQGLSDAPIAWEIALTKIMTKLPIRKVVRLHLSEKVFSPLTIGHLKPIILFPIALVNNMDQQQVEAILLHELAHIKRNDYLLNLIGVLIETILFFNPFIWLLSQHVQTEREHACDDVVVEKTASAINYAQALVYLESLKQHAHMPLAMPAIGKKQHLLHRIKRITQMEKSYINVKQHLFALGISSLAFATIAWIAPEKKQVEEEKEVQLSEQHIWKTEKEASLLDLIKPITDLSLDNSSAVSLSDTSARKLIIFNNGTVLALDSAQQALHNSPEWKEKIAKIEENAKRIEALHSSPEWKEKIAKIEENAKRIEAHHNSPEWKEKIAKIEENAKRIEALHSSPEWKEKIAKIEENGKRIEAYFNSPEWKEKIKSIEHSGKNIEVYFNSPEWKEKVNNMENNGKKIEVYFNSPEWKEKVNKLGEAGVKIGEMTNLNAEIITGIFNNIDFQDLKVNLESLKNLSAK